MYFVKYIIFITILYCPIISHAGSYRLVGATSVGAYVSQLMDLHPERFANLDITIEELGAGKGLAALAAGKADIAMISMPVNVMKTRLPHLPWNNFNVYALPSTYITFVVHRSNPVTTLTSAQITKILKKDITSWADLGGKNQRIYIITEFRTGGVRATVEDALLQGRTIEEPILKLESAAQITPYTAQLENALGIVTQRMVDDRVVEITTTEKIEQPLYFITNGPASPEVSSIMKLFQENDIQQGVID